MRKVVNISTELKGGDEVVIKRTEVRSMIKEVDKASRPKLFRVPVNPGDPAGLRFNWFRREELIQVLLS